MIVKQLEEKHYLALIIYILCNNKYKEWQFEAIKKILI